MDCRASQTSCLRHSKTIMESMRTTMETVFKSKQKYLLVRDTTVIVLCQYLSNPQPSLPLHYLLLLAAIRIHKIMYHHANTNINPLQSPDHDSKSTKSSEARRRQIPLAFTNTQWGKEYVENPNWEHENLGRCNPTVRRGSRFRSEPETNANRSASVSLSSRGTSEIQPAEPSTNLFSSTTAPPVQSNASSMAEASSQEYSVMVAWKFFCRSFPQNTSPASLDVSATEQETSTHPRHEESVSMGPWLEMLMRWDDFEHWRLKMLDRSWYLPVTSE